MLKLLFLPVKVVRMIAKVAGVKGGIWLAIGAGVALVVAPQTGRDLRAKLQARLAGADDKVPADRDLSL